MTDPNAADVNVDVLIVGAGQAGLGTGHHLARHTALGRRVRQDAGIATIGVGLMWDPQLIERSLTHGEMDLVALAREPPDDPNWTLHAARLRG